MGTLRVGPTKLPLSEVVGSGREVVRFDRADFYANCDRSGGPDACWPWAYGRDPQGYGQGPFGWTRKAHRESYRLTHGVRPERPHVVMHTCDNPPCVNPAHLRLGTQSENILDSSRKGRLNSATGERHSQSKLTWDVVRAIREKAEQGTSQRALAREYGVSQVAIHFVVKRVTWANDPRDQRAEVAA